MVSPINPQYASFRPRHRRGADRERRPATSETAPCGDAGAAAFLAHRSLAGGLETCLRLADERSPYFPPAALSCHCRLRRGCPWISKADAETARTALTGLLGPRRYLAAERLRDIYERYEQGEAVDVLDAWIAGPPSNLRSGGVTSAHAQVELESENE